MTTHAFPPAAPRPETLPAEPAPAEWDKAAEPFTATCDICLDVPYRHIGKYEGAELVAMRLDEETGCWICAECDAASETVTNTLSGLGITDESIHAHYQENLRQFGLRDTLNAIMNKGYARLVGIQTGMLPPLATPEEMRAALDTGDMRGLCLPSPTLQAHEEKRAELEDFAEAAAPCELTAGDIYDDLQERLAQARTLSLTGEKLKAASLLYSIQADFEDYETMLLETDLPLASMRHAFEVTRAMLFPDTPTPSMSMDAALEKKQAEFDADKRHDDALYVRHWLIFGLVMMLLFTFAWSAWEIHDLNVKADAAAEVCK